MAISQNFVAFSEYMNFKKGYNINIKFEVSLHFWPIWPTVWHRQSLKIWDFHQYCNGKFHVLKSCQENKLPWIITKSCIPAVPTNLNTKFNVQGVLKRLLSLLWTPIWIKSMELRIFVKVSREVSYQMPWNLSKSLHTPLKTLLLKEKCQKAPGSYIYTMIPFLHWEKRMHLRIQPREKKSH